MSKNSLYIFIGLMIVVVIGYFYSKGLLNHSKDQKPGKSKDIALLIEKGQVHSGDIIFQTSGSGQSKAIQLATHSEYSHCGIIFKNDTGYSVLEAVQPVKRTGLSRWISKGLQGHYIIKRLKNVDKVLTANALQKMNSIGNGFTGKGYDIYFDWSDDKMYCSELVWKVYKRATGIEIGSLQKLSDFDLSNNIVKQKLKDRYGNKIPLNEMVISPSAILNSDLLETVVVK
jgi:uncharacterized protein YycO